MPFSKRSSIPANKHSWPSRPTPEPNRNTRPVEHWQVYPRIPDPGPLATTNQDVLVIGIGTFGGYVLEQLAKRLEDVNANGQTSKPNMLYLRMPKATGYPEVIKPHQYVDLLELTEDNLAPTEEDLAQPHWAWLEALGYQPGEIVRGRQAARTVLFNHLKLGPNLSTLVDKLENYLRQRPSFIFLVASAYEVVGAGLIGDLAALIRCFAPDNYMPSIDALVLTESSNAQPEEENAYLAATLHELGRLNVEGRPRMSYTAARDTRLHYPPQPGDMQLLNGLGLILGDNNEGVQRAAMLLWGILTVPQFLTGFHAALTSRPLENRLIPSVSLVFAHALVRPLNLLAQVFMYKLVYDVIGREQLKVSRRSDQPLTREEIDEILESGRQKGLWPSVDALRQMDQTHSDYFGEIAAALKDQQNAASLALDEIRHQITWFCAPHSALAYDVPVEVEDWLNQRCQPERLEDLRRQLRLVANPIPSSPSSSPFYLRIAPDSSEGRPINLIARNREDVENEWMYWICLLAKHEAWTALKASETLLSFHQVLGQKRYEGLRQRWQTCVHNWRQTVQDEIEGLEFGPRGKLFYLNVPENWQTNVVGDKEVINSNDPTFALQVWVIQPIPLSNLKRVRQTRNVQSYLIHDVEGLVLRIFGDNEENLLHMPVALQNALSYQQALQRFFAFWYDGQAYRLRRSPQVTNLPWNRALSSFIARHEEDQFLASHEEQMQIFFELLRHGVLEDVDPELPPDADWLRTIHTFISHALEDKEVTRRIEYVQEHAEAAYVWGDLRRIAKELGQITLTIPGKDNETVAQITLADLIEAGLSQFVEYYERDEVFRQAAVNCAQEHRGVWLRDPTGGAFETYLAKLFRRYLVELT